MKAVVYFSADDLHSARLIMAQLKAAGHDAHWSGIDEFEDPRDVEAVDQVFMVTPSAKVENAYKARGIPVSLTFQMQAPETVEEPADETPVRQSRRYRRHEDTERK